ERRQTQPRQLRDGGEQLPHHLAEGGLGWQVGAIRGQIDGGQHDLAVALGEQRARLYADRLERPRSAPPARIGDDGEGAGVVAALRLLQIGPGPGPPLTLSLSRWTRRGNARRGLPYILLLPACGERAGVRGIHVALGPEFGGVVEDEIDLRER